MWKDQLIKMLVASFSKEWLFKVLLIPAGIFFLTQLSENLNDGFSHTDFEVAGKATLTFLLGLFMSRPKTEPAAKVEPPPQ